MNFGVLSFYVKLPPQSHYPKTTTNIADTNVFPPAFYNNKAKPKKKKKRDRNFHNEIRVVRF